MLFLSPLLSQSSSDSSFHGFPVGILQYFTVPIPVQNFNLPLSAPRQLAVPAVIVRKGCCHLTAGLPSQVSEKCAVCLYSGGPFLGNRVQKYCQVHYQDGGGGVAMVIAKHFGVDGDLDG